MENKDKELPKPGTKEYMDDMIAFFKKKRESYGKAYKEGRQTEGMPDNQAKPYGWKKESFY